MLENIQDLNFESYIHDIEDIDIKEICFDKKSNKIVNLVLFFGDTIGNFTDENHVWSNLKNSLGKDDLLIVSNKLDKNENKSRFDEQKTYYQRYLFVPNLLGIDISKPKISFIFNEKKTSSVCVFGA